ncbi:hypothetical protein GXN76_15055 [Kroppenstedtia pulmonis]|uniref:Uncharacterized protein n=1 Tax=Kroppenstedtia pulmonis TaxID=1380685 RepID=A0A7D4BXS5_9BACL|nr:hypothetical protein [Kroppenstedtia pulmonis]QKG85633.1 hypothetical protein GXN76_15055 [Kroppenstedtia pulmonis]
MINRMIVTTAGTKVPFFTHHLIASTPAAPVSKIRYSTTSSEPAFPD